MSKPAARMGDTTAHGGTITVGEPTVLIGGKPAARVGDMHVCPMLNPGTPPPPHVGGPILMGSMTVLIGNKPAARVGDMCQCSGPPDTIAMGCPTVLIGDSGGGGGGGVAGQSEGAADGESGGESQEVEEENHYLDVKVVDKAGKPIAGVGYQVKTPDNKTYEGVTFGKIKQSGVKEGSHEIALHAITKAEWSAKKARNGEKVKMLVETVGIEDGTKAKLEIFERSTNVPDKSIKVFDDLAVQNGKVQAEWQYEFVDEEEEETETTVTNTEKYFSPSYYFTVQIGSVSTRSPMLEYKDFIELYLKDGEGNAIGGARYRVFLSNGEVREGELDSNGYKKIEKVPPGKWTVQFPDYGAPDEE